MWLHVLDEGQLERLWQQDAGMKLPDLNGGPSSNWPPTDDGPGHEAVAAVEMRKTLWLNSHVASVTLRQRRPSLLDASLYQSLGSFHVTQC